MPEVDFTVGYQVNERLRLTAGYTFLYWSSVVRPGDQIDTVVNPLTAINDPANDPNSTRPRFTFVEDDYWAQGFSFGAEYHW